MDEQENTSRGGFLRNLGLGLAVAVGAAALPSKAKANAGQCCASEAHCGTCSAGKKNYWCDCISFFYCTGCRADQGTCFPANC
jgi:hypothetical protein